MKGIFNCAKLDIRAMKSNWQSILIVVVLGFAIGMISKSGYTVLGMLGIGSIMIAPYPFAIGDKNKLDILYGTLPIDKKSAVFGRYLFALLFIMLGVVVAFGISAVISLVYDKTAEIKEMFTISCLMLAIGLVIVAFQYPIYFKLGYTKARIASFIPLVIIFGLVALVPLLAKPLHFSVEQVLSVFFEHIALSCIGALLVGVLVFGLSGYFSNKIYAKKDI